MAGVSESELYMWRAIFALAHADHVVTREEQRFMSDVLEDNSFSEEQRHILLEDIENPRSPSDMFDRITGPEERSRFFYYARMLLWCDGDFAEQEQRILTKLGEAHYRSVDFDQMITEGKFDFEIADEQKQWLREDIGESKGEENLLRRFAGRFMKKPG